MGRGISILLYRRRTCTFSVCIHLLVPGRKVRRIRFGEEIKIILNILLKKSLITY